MNGHLNSLDGVHDLGSPTTHRELATSLTSSFTPALALTFG